MPVEFDLLRSWLFVPGDSPRKLEKCWGIGADAVVIDLEDAVGAAGKDAARRLAAEALASAERRASGTCAFVRLGAAAGPKAKEDLEATLPMRPDGYVLPKVERGAQIDEIAGLLDRLEPGHGIAGGSVRLVPIVTETPTAVLRLGELCRDDGRSGAVIWGSEDLSAAIGARRVKRADGEMLDVFRVVRALTLVAASAAGLAAVDTPVVELGDLERLRRECEEAAASGFTGKLAMHPAQVAVINEGFLPAAEEVRRARDLLDGMSRSAGGVFRFGDQMGDLPHARRAERIVRLAEARGAGPVSGSAASA